MSSFIRKSRRLKMSIPTYCLSTRRSLSPVMMQSHLPLIAAARMLSSSGVDC